MNFHSQAQLLPPLCTGMLCVRIALGKNYSNWINAFGKGVTCHVVMVVTAIKMHQATLSIAALKMKRIYRHELAASWIGFHFLKGDITFLMKNEHWNDASSRRSWKVWKNGEKSCILAHVLQCLLYHHYSADQLTFGVLYGLQSLKRIFLRNLKKIRRSMSLLPMINKRSNEQLKSLKTTQEIHILKMSQFLSHLWHTKWLVTFTKQERKFDFLLFGFW